MTLLMGVDVSKYQGVVDWSRLKEYGYTFAIIRAGYGMYEKQEDPYFIRNITEAVNLFFKTGVVLSSSASSCSCFEGLLLFAPLTDAPYPAASTALMITSGVAVPSTPIELVRRLTAQLSTPGTLLTAFSTLA